MTCFICRQCGVQFADSATPPPRCPVCDDERQYHGFDGQVWVTLEELRRSHSIRLEPQGDFLGLGMRPQFAIGQRALLVDAPGGNVLWDCITLITDEAVEAIRKRGGLTAVAISHPHYYSSMVEWSHAFGGIPVYLHADDRQWIMRPDPVLELWDGETLEIAPSLTLIRCGGHFAGGTVMHYARAGDSGVLFAGDILQVVADRKHLSFMYSYPNYIPLNSRKVKRIAAAVEPYDYDAIYGAWWGFQILTGARKAMEVSVARYLKAIAD